MQSLIGKKIDLSLDRLTPTSLFDMTKNHHDIIADLKIKILVSNEEFITSDNPVVLYNKFNERRNTLYVGSGLASIGLQIFFPISPHVVIMLYDHKIYSIQNNICNHDDVRRINGLQCINAHRNLYFSSNISEESIKKIFGPWATYRAEYKRSETSEHKINARQSIIATHRNIIQTDLLLSFISMTDYSRKLQLPITLWDNARKPCKKKNLKK